MSGFRDPDIRVSEQELDSFKHRATITMACSRDHFVATATTVAHAVRRARSKGMEGPGFGHEKGRRGRRQLIGNIGRLLQSLQVPDCIPDRRFRRLQTEKQAANGVRAIAKRPAPAHPEHISCLSALSVIRSAAGEMYEKQKILLTHYLGE